MLNPYPFDLTDFIVESNKIEGIPTNGDRLDREVPLYETFLGLPEVRVKDLEEFVRAIAPAQTLRDQAGMDGRVGSYIAPRGGPEIRTRLGDLLARVNSSELQPYHAHHEYETLHPFMDGNGRSGRLLWLWMHAKAGGFQPLTVLQRGFLHSWYYESLQYGRK